MRRREESVCLSGEPDPGAFLPLPTLPYQILLALAESSRHGWGIIKRVEELSGLRAKPSSGSLYLAVARLEERGLVSVSPEPESTVAGGELRRIYQLSGLGRRVLALETLRLTALVRQAERSLGVAARDSLSDA